MINIAVVESPFQFWMAREYQEQSKSRLDFIQELKLVNALNHIFDEIS